VGEHACAFTGSSEVARRQKPDGRGKAAAFPSFLRESGEDDLPRAPSFLGRGGSAGVARRHREDSYPLLPKNRLNKGNYSFMEPSTC
jgi:hypothetical protein